MFSISISTSKIRCDATVCKKDEYVTFVNELGREEIIRNRNLTMPPRTSSPIRNDEEINVEAFSDSLDEFFYQSWKNRLESQRQDYRSPQCPCPKPINKIQNYILNLIDKNVNQNEHFYEDDGKFLQRQNVGFVPGNGHQRRNFNQRRNFHRGRNFQQKRNFYESRNPQQMQVDENYQVNQYFDNVNGCFFYSEPFVPTYYPCVQYYAAPLIYYPVGYREDGTYGPLPFQLYYCYS